MKKEESLSDDYLKGWKDGKTETEKKFREAVRKCQEELQESIVKNKDLELKHLLVIQHNIPFIFKKHFGEKLIE